MTRKNLISLMVLDLIVMALAIALMAYRYQAFSSLPISSLKQNTKQLSDEPEAAPQAMPQAAQADIEKPAEKPDIETAREEKTATAATAEKRNISFTYKNSKVKKVEIIGDFTDWIPKKMLKGAAGLWRINLALAPGDYAYNFVINGKPKRDPNNAKICNAGRGFPNSFLKVKPLSNDNNKAE